MGKEIATQVQETQRVPYRINPRRNTPKHILIKLTKIKLKEKILKAAREKQKITYKRIPIRYQLIFQQKLCKPEGSGRIYLKSWRRKNYSQDYATQQGSHSDLMEKLKPLQTIKAKRIQHHQTSSTTNAKGTSLSGKHKRRKGPTNTNPKQLRKWS